MSRNIPVFLDFQSTTPLNPRVFEKMKPFFTDKFGNPHSNFHQFGIESKEGVEGAREKIAETIKAYPEEIVFCSGATEANNLAIAKLYKISSEYKRIITLETEHKCILESCENINSDVEVVKLKVNEKGLLDLNLLEDELKKGPAVVSVMIVNNEIGVIQPIQEISELCFKYNSLIHSDAAQAIGKIPLNVNELNIAAMSLSAHKFYGPKGIGAFYINREIKNKIEPIIYGGGQEYKIRSGTVPTPLCVGMGEAAMISNTDLIKNNQKVMSHRNNFIKIMDNKLDEYHINGCMDNRILHNLNIRISKVDADELIMNTPVVAFSNGSACSSGEIQSSHVLRSMGLNDQYARESFRISFSHLLSDEEISKAANAIIRSAKKILGSR